MLGLLIGAPLPARADDEPRQDAPRSQKKSKSKSKHAVRPKQEEPPSQMRFDDLAAVTPKSEKDPVGAPPEAHSAPFRVHRYAYFLGGGLLVTGLAFAYFAQGEAKRAETIGTAREAAQALGNARASAATSNVVYGLAISTLVVALLFEVLAEPTAQAASLTFHF